MYAESFEQELHRKGIFANGRVQEPSKYMPKLFSELRERYSSRPGGYTRVLRIESHKEDHAPSAILELVDGVKDMRFAMTAKTLVRERAEEMGIREWTAKNVEKVTRFRPNGKEELEQMVVRLEERDVDETRRQQAGERKEYVYKVRANPRSKGWI